MQSTYTDELIFQFLKLSPQCFGCRRSLTSLCICYTQHINLLVDGTHIRHEQFLNQHFKVEFSSCIPNVVSILAGRLIRKWMKIVPLVMPQRLDFSLAEHSLCSLSRTRLLPFVHDISCRPF